MRCNKNQPSNLGSSETIREATPFIEFNDYEKLGKPQHIKQLDRPFLEWFIGFSEGDGLFDQSQLAFIINQKDPKLLFRIKKKLGFGSVYETSDSGIWRYSVTGKTNCLRLYYLFNGNLTLQKIIDKFVKWTVMLSPKLEVQKNPIPMTLNSAWLAGFIEAEGCFYGRVRVNKRMKTGFQFQKKFYISQKGEKKVLQTILELLESESKVYTFQQNGETYNRIEASSFHSHSLLLNYLDISPIFGQKNISICIWRRMHGRQDRSEHLTIHGLDKLRHLCYLLNKHNQRFQ